MLPTIALVGRPNVGKSTLFNRLTKSRDALVADFPGLTRDRQYGRGRSGERAFLVVDTGGFEPVATTGILAAMAKQAKAAIAESDAVIFIVDAREGVAPQDHAIAELLRKSGRPVLLAVNKAEGLPAARIAEFHELGVGDPLPISAAHGENVRDLVDVALDACPQRPAPAPGEDEAGFERRIAVAVVGRPNVGKSTLVNALLGEERVIAFDEPGTTRDAIRLDFERGDRRYTLIDTAGVRRRGRVSEAIEKFSVIKALQAIEDANVVILLLDAVDGIGEQDAHLAGHVVEAGRALTVGINKWDAANAEQRELVRRELARKLGFLDFAEQHFVSAREGRGVDALLASVDRAYRAAMTRLPTPKLTRTLQLAIERQQPPRAGVVRPKMRYAHQGGVNPPVVVVHGSALAHVPDSYRRYLLNAMRRDLKLGAVPLRLDFRGRSNPFDRARR